MKTPAPSFPARLAAAAFAANATVCLAALELSGMDKSADPCTDFFSFANGRWLAQATVPADRTTWGTFSIVEANNEKIIEEVIRDALRAPPPAGSSKRKFVEYFASGMDTAAIEKAGVAPIEPIMRRIDAVRGPEDLARAFAELQSRGIEVAFSFAVRQDAKDSTRYIPEIGQGGLGLPDRDHYFTDDGRTRRQREAYLGHVARMFELYGDTAAEAAARARAVFELETELAKASRKRVDLRDPEGNYHKKTPGELEALAQRMPWAEYFRALGASRIAEVNVRQPEFVKRMAELLAEKPLADWRSYLRWHVLRGTGSMLPEKFAAERFAFEERVMKGGEQRPPRFREVLEITSGRRGSEPMGQALGQLFVERAFSAEAKARALELVGNVKAAFAERLRGLDWMDGETRTRALEKLAAMNVKIGYPDKWRDYSDADVGPHAFVENWMRSHQFEMRRHLRRLGQPIDRTDWWMGPQAVNAYYSGSLNEIVFPAGILQPPFFDAKADDAVNYGGIGMVIGHEITHGFDDRGRKFDAQGNLRDWWTAADARRYVERAQRIARQYATFDGPDGLKVNGMLTLGENISDVGGLKIAYLALQKALATRPQGRIDGFTPQQRFFLSFAQIWRRVDRPEHERLLILTDSHSPARYRVKGPLAHLPEFAQSFSCDFSRTLLTEGERANLW